MAESALNWALVQVFLAVVEQGSLTGAAKQLGLSQPTAGRQVRALEQQLGAELFHRHEKGLSPTELGTSLLASARLMREAAKAIELRVAGEGDSLAGSVRISASEAVSLLHLPMIVAHIHGKEPQIAIDVVPSDETSRLHYREADIAIRMYRPTQLDLITKHVGDLSLTAYASRAYVKRRGIPKTLEELLEHDIVGFDRSTVIIDAFRRAGADVDRDFFKARTDHTPTYLALVRAGCGIGFTQLALVRRDRDLVEIPLQLGIPKLPVWVTAHEAIRHAPRVQRVWDLLEAELSKIVDEPGGA